VNVVKRLKDLQVTLVKLVLVDLKERRLLKEHVVTLDHLVDQEPLCKDLMEKQVTDKKS